MPVDSADVPEWFISLGFNPTWEAIGVQVFIVAVAALGLLWIGKRRTPATAS